MSRSTIDTDLHTLFLDVTTEGDEERLGAEPPETPPPADRYTRLALLGRGGMGAVYRVHDRLLDRTLAMKVLRPSLFGSDRAKARFVAEARCSARLQHPGIVPVHDLGMDATGAPYFTMREVQGRTFGSTLSATRAAGGPDIVALRRLLALFQRVCAAVAYAHSMGVVHRDLKPANIMLGPHGEALVVDWGLARQLTPGTPPVLPPPARGPVVGTPAYMAPEQARGETHLVGPPTDVYALGAVLYELLSGSAPMPPGPPRALVADLASGVRPAPLTADQRLPDGQPLPPGLVAAVERAMAPAPDDRHPDARALADDLSAWLEGARRREEAREVVRTAAARRPEATRIRAESAQLRAEAHAALAQVPTWAAETAKAHPWSLLDHADRLERDADRLEHAHEQALASALRIDPTLPEAHAGLIEIARARHAHAEQHRDASEAARAKLDLEAHAQALPARHPVRRAAEAYLDGSGRLTLTTEPAGAQVELLPFETHHRRLVTAAGRVLGTTPLEAVPLPMGSYVCRISRDGHETVRYPVHVGRCAHWAPVRPGSAHPTAVRLPPLGSIDPESCVVPGGWTVVGGDPEAADALPRMRVWVDGFVLRRTPVTNAEYLTFLDDLHRSGDEALALRCVPRERAARPGELGRMIYGRRDDGTFFLQPDADGDAWPPDFPVVQVDWWGARAYCAWLAERTGTPWRLPTELEWEKAARGVDGRFCPWGDHVDPAWACMRGSLEAGLSPASVHAFDVDESVYGVRGLAGNVRDWCADAHTEAGPRRAGALALPVPDDPRPDQARVSRGGDWCGLPSYVRSASRVWSDPTLRNPYVSFRPAHSLGG